MPVRLIGEDDLHVLPVTEEMSFETENAGLGKQGSWGGKYQHTGVCGRITTHRFVWRCDANSSWIALRFDYMSKVEAITAFMRTRYCQIYFTSGRSIDVKVSDGSRAENLLTQLQAAITAGRWRQGSYEVAALGGLQRILAHREAKQQVVGETLDFALTDLKALKEHAAQTVAAARQVAANGAEQGADGGVQGLLEEFGLLGSDGRLVVKGGGTRKDVEADVRRVCEAALTKRGGLGMLLAHDVYCLVNRARGTGLVSPEEVMNALKSCHASGQLRLRTLGSTGAFAASLPRTSDSEADERLLKLADEAPLSSFLLAKELGLTAMEAQYLLRDSENREVLVRDEAPEGVFYYRNFFNDS